MSTKPAPYPADVRAKGWRLELDHERMEQSDTWALAGDELRPWLLMLWLTAWKQAPIASLPKDERIIAAKIGMNAKAWAKARDILMRGWWLADDGRLYHDVLAQRVSEMLTKKERDRLRKGGWRARQSADVPRDTTGTGQGQGEDGQGNPTGKTPPSTKHQAVNIEVGGADTGLPVLDGHEPTKNGLACRAMRSAGMADTNPGDPRLIALVDQGATLEEFQGAAADAVAKKKGFAWALAALAGKRADAATIALTPAVTKPVNDGADKTAAYLREQAERGVSAVPDAVRQLKARMAVRALEVPT